MPYLNIYLPVLILITLSIVIKYGITLKLSEYRILILYLIVTLFVESAANTLDYYKQSNLSVYNIGMIFEVNIFLNIFLKKSTDKIKTLLHYTITIFNCFALVNIIFFQKYNKFQSNTYTLACLLLMFVTLSFLFKLIIKKTNSPLRDFFFWFSIGVLFCYLGNFPYLSSLNSLIALNDNTEKALAIISITVNSLLYLLISIGVVCNRREAN